MTTEEILSLRPGHIVRNKEFHTICVVTQVGAGDPWVRAPGFLEGPGCPLSNPHEWELVPTEEAMPGEAWDKHGVTIAHPGIVE